MPALQVLAALCRWYTFMKAFLAEVASVTAPAPLTPYDLWGFNTFCTVLRPVVKIALAF